MTNTFYAETTQSMFSLGESLAQKLSAPCVIHLVGNLGVGKTIFAKGFLVGLGYDDLVKSPTYTLVESYEIDTVFCFHFDLYRLSEAEELEEMGIREYFSGEAYLLIEWPEKGEGILPEPDLIVSIKTQDVGRVVSIKALNMVFESLVKNET